MNESRGGVSRRGFCAAAGVGLVSIGLGACTETGGQDGGTAGDLGSSGQPDLAQGQGNGNCAAGVNAGQASAIAAGAAVHFTDNQSYDLFVCRDSGGLYALNAICPHAGCTVRKATSQFFCPCHGATFDLNGQHPTSPAFSPLDHYTLCVDAAGDVIVDFNTTVSATTRS